MRSGSRRWQSFHSLRVLALSLGGEYVLLRITATLHQGIRRMDAMSDALLISLAIWGMIGCAALRVLALLG